ncbi:hypothetical protein PsYK624_121500 [Phanerochaete sordida]|uniref:Uncharacterized protein n=1 Tax=Phanerochaete sordida TaxID=48140 RepID=A0A9P3GIW6_9APHY|nr:hypothetical protein PsYK624_121500 [Phanerochaete sordida]
MGKLGVIPGTRLTICHWAVLGGSGTATAADYSATASGKRPRLGLVVGARWLPEPTLPRHAAVRIALLALQDHRPCCSCYKNIDPARRKTSGYELGV